MRKLLSVIALTLLLAACGQNTPSTPPTAAAPQPTAPAVPSATPVANVAPTPALPYPAPSDVATPTPALAAPYPAPTQPAGAANAPAELVASARDRLAKQLAVDPSKLQMLRAETMQWPDGAIGCPEPGKAYDQYAIPGYLLTFSDGAREYAVHTSLAANPGEPMVFCDNKKPIDLSTAAGPAVLDPQAQAMADLAKQALAKELGIDASAVTVISATPVEWNDSSLGCAKPGQTYLQVITSGYLLRLEANGRGYEYHTDGRNQVVQCTP